MKKLWRRIATSPKLKPRRKNEGFCSIALRMGQFSKWLLHEDQKELFDYLFAVVLNVAFLTITALLLWPMGYAGLTWRLTKGYWVFWVVLFWTAILLLILQRRLRVDMYSHYDAYVISGLVISGVIQAGWSAFAAVVIRDFTADASIGIDIVLYAVGIFSCYVACAIVAAFYMGSIYRFTNLWIAIGTFVAFSIWPAAARVVYGWFFDLF